MVDIDCAAVAYTGSKVLASPRALYSLYTRTILIRPANQFHPLYEARLVKYSRRGFWIADRGLKKSSLPLSDSVYSLARSTLLRENPGANRPQSFQIQGILLLLTVLRYPDVLKHLKIFKVRIQTFLIQSLIVNLQFSGQFKDDAKYKDEGLPYGPHWTTTKIKENLQEGNVRDLETYHWRADHACKLVDNPLEENIELTMKDSYRISDYFFIKNWYNSLAVVTDICGSENVEPAEFYVTQRKPPSYEVFELDDITIANLLLIGFQLSNSKQVRNFMFEFLPKTIVGSILGRNQSLYRLTDQLLLHLMKCPLRQQLSNCLVSPSLGIQSKEFDKLEHCDV